MKYFVGKNDKGFAVFADCSILAGDLIMSCPVVALDKQQTVIVRQTLLDNYIFDWPNYNENPDSLEWTGSAVVLGDGSLINHSDEPNCEWNIDYLGRMMFFRALKNIRFGAEITFNYNWANKKKKRLGFK